jgi:hypothetical protein
MAEPLRLIRRIRYSADQWAEVEVRASECGISPSTYVRRTSLGAIPRARRSVKARNVAYHLAKIGININQLAYRANAGLPVSQSELSEALDRLHGILDEI